MFQHPEQGFLFEKTPEILTPGHITVLLNSRVENVKARAEYSQYLLSPTKFKFEKVIRCYAMVWRFIKSFKCLKNKLTASFDPKFQMFINVNGVKQDQDNDATKSFFNVPVVTSIVTFMDKNQTKKVIEVYNEAYVKGTFDYDILNDEKVVDTHRIAAIEFGSKIIGRQFRGNYHVNITDDDVSRSLKYLFKKSSDEVKKFNKAELVKKVSIEKNGLLYSKSRILDIQRFKLAGGLEDKDIIGK